MYLNDFGLFNHGVPWGLIWSVGHGIKPYSYFAIKFWSITLRNISCDELPSASKIMSLMLILYLMRPHVSWSESVTFKTAFQFKYHTLKQWVDLQMSCFQKQQFNISILQVCVYNQLMHWTWLILEAGNICDNFTMVTEDLEVCRSKFLYIFICLHCVLLLLMRLFALESD